MSSKGTAGPRILKELAAFKKESASTGLSVDMVDESNALRLRGTVTGPRDTPYAGGIYVLDIDIPAQYPFNPPKIKFETKIWHPNVSSQTGAICLDILKDQWAPSMTLRTVLLSIQALMQSPEPDDPQDAVVASQYKSNIALFNQTASQWRDQYAANPETLNQSKINQLVDMGIAEAEARKALEKAKWNVEAAIQQLFA